MRHSSWLLVLILLSSSSTTALAQAQEAPADTAKVHCKIEFNIGGWAFFYRSADGSGTITCSNGDSFDVILEQRGFGLAFGSGDITNARGVFSPVARAEEVLGTYIGQSASAGAGGGDAAGAFMKGSISLAVSGHGDLNALGAGGARLTIKRKEPTEPAASR